MNNNNLSELNDLLFDTLRGINDDKVSAEKVKSIVHVSHSIVSNAKAQLEAFKMTGGRVEAPKIFGARIESQMVIEQGNTYNLMEDFAIKEGYKNVSEAISKMGKSGFNAAFKIYKEEVNH